MTNSTADRSAESLQVDALGEAIGIKQEGRGRRWFTRLASRYFKRNLARIVARRQIDLPVPERAEKAITRACVKSAFSGAACGALSTAATVLTAESNGALGFALVPLAGVAIGGEMMFRAVIHVDLTCELAEIFGVKFDADDEGDFWRLYALAFKTHRHGDAGEDDPGKGLVEKVTHVEGEEVGERIGRALVGESVMRNIVPFAGIITSAGANFLLTRRLGHTVRRYMRYDRALRDALARAEGACKGQLDALIEGMWFIFTADGKLEPEETACLATMLSELDPIRRRAVTQRFTDDEIDWMARLETEVPEESRDAFLHALEVAAAVDKEISLPERKILRRVANIFGRQFDPKRLELLIAEFEDNGVLSAKADHHRVA